MREPEAEQMHVDILRRLTGEQPRDQQQPAEEGDRISRGGGHPLHAHGFFRELSSRPAAYESGFRSRHRAHSIAGSGLREIFGVETTTPANVTA